MNVHIVFVDIDPTDAYRSDAASYYVRDGPFCLLWVLSSNFCSLFCWQASLCLLCANTRSAGQNQATFSFRPLSMTVVHLVLPSMPSRITPSCAFIGTCRTLQCLDTYFPGPIMDVTSPLFSLSLLSGNTITYPCLGGRYAPVAIDKNLLQHLLDVSPDSDVLTFDDLVTARANRDATLRKPFNRVHALISRGAVALTVQTLGDEEGNIPKQCIREWFGEERLPHRWARPMTAIGLWSTYRISNWVGQLVKTKLTHITADSIFR